MNTLSHEQNFRLSAETDLIDETEIEIACLPDGLTGDYFDYWFRYARIIEHADGHQAALWARERRYLDPATN